MVKSPQGRKHAGVVRTLPVLALLSTLACAVAAWLNWGVTPSVVQTVSNLRAGSVHTQTLSDALVVERIALSLAGGDYGEVQEILNRYESVNFLTRAVVINASNRIVAEVGGLEGVRMGDPVPNQMQAAGRKIDISLDSRKLGELLIPAPPMLAVDSVNDVIVGLRTGATLVAALALMLAGAITWHWWQSRNGSDAARADSMQGARSVTVLPAEPSQPAPNSGGAPPQQRGTGFRELEAQLRELGYAPNPIGDMDPAEAVPVLSAPGSTSTANDELEDDCLARIVDAHNLTRNGKKAEAITQLETVDETGIDNPSVQYRMGLAYFEVGYFEKSLVFAHQAYRNGITLPSLKNKLIEAGKWREPSPAPG